MPTGFPIGQCIPPASVDAPPPGAPSTYGLFSAARIMENTSAHELNGVEYEPVCNVRVDEWPLNCTPYRGAGDDPKEHVHECARDIDPMPMPKGKDEGPRWPYGRKLFSHSKGVTTALPFGVYAGEDCFLGNSDPERALADLRQRFTLGEQTTVERVVYHGLMGVVPALRYKPVVLNAEHNPKGKDLPDLLQGIGLLEAWLACSSGALGVIHAPRYLAMSLAWGGGDVRVQGPKAMTDLGNAYVFGGGYSGEAPFADDGKPIEEQPDKVWLYATRPVTIRRSAIIQPADYSHGAASLERNEASLLMERVYVVDWPCDTACVQVDFPRFRLTEKRIGGPEHTHGDYGHGDQRKPDQGKS